MKSRYLSLLLAVVPWSAASGKPPAPSRSEKPPSPSPAVSTNGAAASLLPWLLLQNGGPSAASVPWPEIVLAAGGKQLSPLDSADPSGNALLAKLGASLDAILPRLNRPDGPLRAAAPLTATEVAARAADELRSALPTAQVPVDGPCPVLRWTDNPTGRPCYLVVVPYPVGDKAGALRALTMRAADLAGQFTTEGTCLAVGIAHNGKPGRDLALLNWELIDLARVSLRCAVTFETDADGLHAPGATLADGRRGRD